MPHPADALRDVAAGPAAPPRRRAPRPRAVAIRVTRRAPSSTTTAWARNGTAMPAANRTAPSGGSGHLVDGDEAGHAAGRCRRRGRASATSIGSSVLAVVSANTSAVPSRNIATSTSAMSTWSSDDRRGEHDQDAPRGAGRATITITRRSSRSARAPAYSPNRSQGSLLEQRGERDQERRLGSATPPAAARRRARSRRRGWRPTRRRAATGSPRPRRAGATASTSLLTRRRP